MALLTSNRVRQNKVVHSSLYKTCGPGPWPFLTVIAIPTLTAIHSILTLAIQGIRVVPLSSVLPIAMMLFQSMDVEC